MAVIIGGGNALALPAHRSTHATGGADPIAPASIGAALTDHTHTIATLPVADEGEISPSKLLVASDPRLANITPDDYGLQTWLCDPLLAGDTYKAATSGTPHYTLIRLRRQRTVSGIGVYVRTAGATLTSGRNLQGIYRLSDRALIAQTVDQSTAWTSTQGKNAALTAPIVLDPGDYYIVTLATGTTTPTFAAVGSAIAHYYNRTSNTLRGGSNSTVVTALPATLPSATQVAAAIWVGLY